MELVIQFWSGNEWINDEKYTYAYNEDDYEIECLGEKWSNLNWVNDWKNTYSYDDYTNLIETLECIWNGTNWINFNRYHYSYIITEIEQSPLENKIYYLSNNFPNPFNPTTKIKYSIPKLSFVTLKVFDVLGKEIETLVNKDKHTGNYEVEFNAAHLPSGVYFYKLQAGNYIETKKMLLLK